VLPQDGVDVMAQSRRFAARARREDPVERVAADASSDIDLDSDHGTTALRRKGGVSVRARE